tara:strand:- start:196 stop:567 length:372 start_codon:yes stop_codon:yes gene_type:complete
MSLKTYKDIIRLSIIGLGGKATVYEIYGFIENNYPEFIKGKAPKTWQNTVRYNLCRGDFHQVKRDRKMVISGYGGSHKYWYNNDSGEIQTPEERFQKRFEESLKFFRSNKEYCETMLDLYLQL